MKANTQSQSDQVKKNISNPKFNSKYFFIGFIAVSFIAAFVIGGIVIGKNKTNKQLASTEIKEQVKITANELPQGPDKWQAYKLETLGMELKLPEKLAKEGDWKEQVIPANQKGSIICFSTDTSKGAVCSGKVLLAGGTSTDFSEGREGTFTDLQGFSKENGKIFIKTTGGNKFELENAKFREINNVNGVEVLKVLGENQTLEGSELPLSGTPGEGYLGAIVNTNNSKYPGFAIQLKLEGSVSEYEFDQILESIKFTKNNE